MGNSFGDYGRTYVRSKGQFKGQGNGETFREIPQVAWESLSRGWVSRGTVYAVRGICREEDRYQGLGLLYKRGNWSKGIRGLSTVGPSLVN